MKSPMAASLPAALLLVSLGACRPSDPMLHGDDLPGVAERPLEELALAGNPAVAGHTEFSFHLYRTLAATERGNVVVSPLSIDGALAMTSAGAAGNTLAELDSVLGIDAADAERHRHIGDLLAGAASDDNPAGATVRLANALWIQDGMPVHAAFTATLAASYGAGAHPVSFETAADRSATANAINAWASRNTGGLIKDLISPSYLDAMTRLVITNAIHFRGEWDQPFKKQATHDGPFTRADGSRVQAPLMHQKDWFEYAELDGFRALAMPYKGEAFSMVWLLPDAHDGLPALEASLTTELVGRVLAALDEVELQVVIPKFKATADLQLRPALEAMGIRDAFDPAAADFTGIASGDTIFITRVVHKAVIEVDERGAEAAAATGVIGSVTSAPARPVPEFIADRPFCYILRDTRSGAILFMGRVVDPAAP